MKEFLRSYPVTIKDWLKYHPYAKATQADYYYLKLCNTLLKKNIDVPIVSELEWSEYKEMTCMMVCYFEDIISETNIWRAFTGTHKKLYGKYLPFYDTSANYFDDEINKQDIKFLIWHFVSIVYQDKLLNPFYVQFSLIAEEVFDVFDAEYETAPQNQQFKDKMTMPPGGDIFETRNILDFLAFGSYLNHPYASRAFEEGVKKMTDTKRSQERETLILYHYRIGLLFNGVSPLLALRANEQLADIIGEDHPRYHEIKSISKRISATCTIKGMDDEHLLMEHVASGKKINLSLKTVSQSRDNEMLIPGKKRLWASMVEWGDEWMLMGTLAFLEPWQGNDNVAEEKYLFDPVEPKLEILDFNEACFRDFAGGALAYFENSEKYTDFINELRVYQFNKANPGKKFPAYARLEGEKDLENIVMFFNHHAGTELYPDFTIFVNDDRNPYFNPEAKVNIEEVITEKTISAQFVEYLVTNKMIVFDQHKSMDDQTIIDNLDFLLRYFKREDYFSEPRITIVDEQKFITL